MNLALRPNRVKPLKTAMAALCATLPILAASVPAMSQDADAPEPSCTGETGSGCWLETANRPGCYIWNSFPAEEETVTWSGNCLDGRPSGRGTLTWRFKEDGQRKSDVHEGMYVDGEEQGHWVERFADGTVYEGPYVDGKEQGHWVLRIANGDLEEGAYQDGERHGRWVLRGADGGRESGGFLDGKRHGRWVERLANGNVHAGPYVDGKRHGHWIFRRPESVLFEGSVEEGPFVDDKRHGRWVLCRADGAVYEGTFRHGWQVGKFVRRRAGGAAEGLR